MGRRRLIRDTPPLALGVAAALLAAGVGVFQIARDARREEAHREFAAEAAGAAVTFAHDLTTEIVALETIAESIDPPAPSVAVVRPADIGYVVEAGTPELPGGTDLVGLGFLASALDAARDDGSARVATGRIADTLSPVGLVVSPAYAGGETPPNTAARRAQLAGFGVVVVDVAGQAADAFGDLEGTVEIRDGSLVLFRRGPEPTGEAVESTIPVAGRSWAVAATTVLPGASVTAWSALAIAVLLAGIVLMEATSRTRSVRRIHERAEARAREDRLIAEVGPLLQSSLQLSEMLPSVAVRLADDFDLAAVSIDVPAAEGRLGGAFSYGEKQGREPASVVEVGDESDLTLPLVRGGRTFGSLTVRPRRALDADQERALAAAAEVVGGAVANAAAYESEQAMVERLNEIDRLKTEFLGTVSHELRTPLTAIAGFAHLLDHAWNELDPASIRDYVSRISRNASSLSSLLQQVLDFSRLDRERLSVAPHEVDLAEVVERAVEGMAPLCEEHRVRVETPKTLHGWSDPDALERVVVNLLTNAVKFTPAGSTITVSLAADGDDAVLVLDDEGSGVDPDDRVRIFERFYRGSSEAALRTRGAGIGLAVVKELVERLGGSVSAGESPTGGARFVARVPALNSLGAPTAAPAASGAPEGGRHEITT